jgi:DnaJ-domain-containing protein 1
MISAQVIDAALRHQLRARLDALFRVRDAAISFHVARGRPRGRAAVPLSPGEALAGRPRARDARTAGQPRDAKGVGERGRADARAADPVSTFVEETPRKAALRVLGLSEGATAAEVRRAFRSVAKEAHPDLHAHATEPEKRALEARFALLSAAYHVLS